MFSNMHNVKWSVATWTKSIYTKEVSSILTFYSVCKYDNYQINFQYTLVMAICVCQLQNDKYIEFRYNPYVSIQTMLFTVFFSVKSNHEKVIEACVKLQSKRKIWNSYDMRKNKAILTSRINNIVVRNKFILCCLSLNSKVGEWIWNCLHNGLCHVWHGQWGWGVGC